MIGFANPSVIVIAGPTASGKSALALDIALEFEGTIINADSMQVYQELRVLTARPTAADEARVPHRLFGTVAARDAYSVGRWLEDAKAEIEAACAANRLPVIAGGTGAFGPVRLPLHNVAEFEGTSLFYLVRRKADLAGKRVVIAGGGDSAVDWAVALQGVASHISVVHRRKKFRAAPDNVRKMHQLSKDGHLEMVVPYQLTSLEGEGGHIRSVCVTTLDGEERVLDADVVLAFFGLVNNLGPIAEWGINLDHQRHIIVTADTCATNLPGVFAVGDIATYPGKLKLILTGFSEAAVAAHAIHPLIHPDRELHFEYSTTKGVPGMS